MSTIRSYKKLWVGQVNYFSFANKWNFAYSRMGELLNINRLLPRLPYCRSNISFSVQFLHQAADSFGLNISQFVEYGWNDILCEPDTLHVISNWSCDRQRHNEHTFLGFHWTWSGFAANRANDSCFGGINAYLIPWQIHLHIYMRHNTPFYSLTKTI